MAFTQREAQIRDEILSALANQPNGRVVAPHAIGQLRTLCNFPLDTTLKEIEMTLQKMVEAKQITLGKDRLVIWRIALTNTTREA